MKNCLVETFTEFAIYFYSLKYFDSSKYLRNRVKKCSARCTNDTNRSIVIDKRLLVVRLTVIDSPSRKSKFNFREHSTTLREEFQQSAAIGAACVYAPFYQSCAKKSIDKKYV